MANTKHAIVRRDLTSGTTDASMLVSLKYFSDVSKLKTAEIDNGNIVAVEGDLLDGEREIYIAKTPTAATPLKNIVLVANPELFYDETKHHNLDEYVNEAGKTIRGYRLHLNDIFSVTAEAIEGTPQKGKFLNVGATTKLVVADSVSGSDVNVGKIIEVETVGSVTYYVVKVMF